MRIDELFRGERDIARTDLIAIIAHSLSLSKEKVLAGPERGLSAVEVETVRHLTGQRRKGMPIAYITGEREFFSETFCVDEHVLIPRPETELLVERALALLAEREEAAVLDMGTGSGIIGLLLAQRARKQVTCVDLSPQALHVARANAVRLGVDDHALFVCSDLFSAIRPEPRFDLITANLPYIASTDWNSLMVDVRAFEPRCALWGGEGGMEVYARFLDQLPFFLGARGHCLCEVGSAWQAAEVDRLAAGTGLRTTMTKDLSGEARMVEVAWISSS